MAKRMTATEYSKQKHEQEVAQLIDLGFKKCQEWSYLMEIGEDNASETVPNLAMVLIPYFEDGDPITETYQLKIVNSWLPSRIFFSKGYDSFDELCGELLT